MNSLPRHRLTSRRAALLRRIGSAESAWRRAITVPVVAVLVLALSHVQDDVASVVTASADATLGTSTLESTSGEQAMPSTRARTAAPRASARPTGSASGSAAPGSSAPASSAPGSAAPKTANSSPSPAGTASPASTQQGAGSLAPGAATYPVPAGAVVVSPTGNDAAAGTLSAPLRTLARAVAVAKSRSTIVLRAGGYHEQVTIPANKTLTVQAYPGEVVWLDGSSVVSSWQQQGSAWVHTGWTAQFDSTPGYSAPPAGAPSWINAQHPMAAHPDEVFLDGQQLTQVASLSKVVAHTFYVDYSTHSLYVGSNPAGHLVRASDLATALTVKSPNTLLRGFGVRRYATSVPLLGTVNLVAQHDQIANVVITDNASQGLHLRAPNVRVDHVTTTYNGLLGIQGNYSDGVQIYNSLVQHNNSEHFNFAPVSGGIKITRSRGIIVRKSVISDNDGNGLWLDESCYNVVLTGNQTQNNTRSGISFELSAVVTIANNSTTGNTYDGIRITDTSTVKIWNNTITDNMSRQIEIVQDSRRNTPGAAGHDPRQPDPDPTVPWISRNVQITDNIFVAGGQYHVYVADSTGARTADQMNVTVDGNMFSAPAIQGYAPIGWGTAPNVVTRYYTPAQFTAATNDGKHNTMSSGHTVQTIKPHVDNSKALPLGQDIASAVNKAVGTKHIGSF